ncbi:hypothetical protein KIL84_006608 [Mauremys mutica]|uniref:Uncharacterized protein n=1 Tax=Mauremys mutica TaxID=74926 RepID=A0A9D3X1S8_9SAUR|nr:hypothetical protein KIL84_006608 [Mauremys mutica]
MLKHWNSILKRGLCLDILEVIHWSCCSFWSATGYFPASLLHRIPGDIEMRHMDSQRETLPRRGLQRQQGSPWSLSSLPCFLHSMQTRPEQMNLRTPQNP